MAQRLIWVIGVGVIAIAGAFVFAKVNGKRTAEMVPAAELLSLVEADLKFEPAKASDDQNAWLAFANLTPVKSREKKPTDLAAMQKALHLSGVYVPDLDSQPDPKKVLVVLRRYGALFDEAAESKAKKGDFAGALADLDAQIQISRTLGKAALPLEYAVVESSMLMRATRSMRYSAAGPLIDESSLQKMIALLPEPDELNQHYLQAVRSDLYWFIRNELVSLKGPIPDQTEEEVAEEDAVTESKDISSGWVTAQKVAEALLANHRDPFDKRETVRTANAIYQEVLQNVSRPWAKQADLNPMVHSLIQEWPPSRLVGGSGELPFEKEQAKQYMPKLLKAKNPYGRFALWFFLTFSDQSNMAPFRNRADLAATNLALACRIYELRNKALPSQLEDLKTAGLMKDLPQDPFGDGGFHYDAKTRRIWSVGPNGVDNGGTGGGTLTPRSPDFVWFVPSDQYFERAKVVEFKPAVHPPGWKKPSIAPMGMTAAP